MHPSHKTRFSDSTHYDEVCTVCGATDSLHSPRGNLPCPGSIPQTVDEAFPKRGQPYSSTCEYYEVPITFTPHTTLLYGLMVAVEETVGTDNLFHVAITDCNLDFESFSNEPIARGPNFPEPTKLEQLLNEAFLTSTLAERATAYAVFIGEIELELAQ